MNACMLRSCCCSPLLVAVVGVPPTTAERTPPHSSPAATLLRPLLWRTLLSQELVFVAKFSLFFNPCGARGMAATKFNQGFADRRLVQFALRYQAIAKQ